MVLYSSLEIIKPVIKLGNGSSQPIGLKRQESRTPTKPRRRCSLRPLLFPPVDITLIMGEGESHALFHVVRARRHELSCWNNLTAVAAWASSRPGEGKGARIPFRNPHPMGCGELYDRKLSRAVLNWRSGRELPTRLIDHNRNKTPEKSSPSLRNSSFT